MKKFLSILIAINIMAVATIFTSLPLSAADPTTPTLAPINIKDTCAVDPSNPACTGAGTFDTTVVTIINFLMGALATVAVVFIVIGGFKLATSSGDPNAVKSAKNTILYSVIGLIVSALSWAIVSFVISRL